MEAVKDLMVCEETSAELFVHKSLVEGLLYGMERHCRPVGYKRCWVFISYLLIKNINE